MFDLSCSQHIEMLLHFAFNTDLFKWGQQRCILGNFLLPLPRVEHCTKGELRNFSVVLWK